MVSFENTEIAFDIKSKPELRKAWWLFRILQIAPLYNVLNGFMSLCIALKIPIGWFVKHTVFKQFCGGISFEESVPVVVKLSRYNVKSILDYSVEGNHSEKEICETMSELVRGIEVPACCANIAFAVFKPSALCPEPVLNHLVSHNILDGDLLHGANVFRERMEELCWKAYEKKVSIMVDAEDFAFQNLIDDTVTEMMEKFNRERIIVYNTVQMYRTDRLNYLSKSLERAQHKGYKLGFKIVRGAYMEKERARSLQMDYPSPIWNDKESTDKAYNEALNFCLGNIDKISVLAGTHNEESCQYLAGLMNKNGIEKNDPRVYFSQLFGMSDNISFNLAKEGYNVAKYIPYGPVNKVLPYLIRRAQENSSIADQTGRELRLISTDLQRRKKLK